jgi:hypothetical protein
LGAHLRRLLLVLFWSSAGLAADPEAVLQQIRTTQLDPSQSAEVTGVKLAVGGGGVLDLRHGFIVPTTPIGAAPVEMVFIGDGTIQLDAPDEIEESQIELFTGSTSLSEDFDEGVFIVGDETTAKALLEHRSPSSSPDQLSRAVALYQTWMDGPERKLLSVESVLFALGLNDRFHDGYFSASIHGRELGPFLYIYHPDSKEELTVGQFVPFSFEKREQRRLRKQLEREQRRGRLLGVRLEDLGQWDTWMSVAIGGDKKVPIPDFEPTRYVLEVDVADRTLHMGGRARIDLTSSGSRQMINLQLHPDLTVHRVFAGAKAAPYFRSGSDLYVYLPSPSAGNMVSVTVEYSGEIVEKVTRKAIALRDTLGWYPRAGTVDRALYDVTFRWPRDLVLISSGKRVDGGVIGERRWEQRTLDHPSFGFSFELGDFLKETFEAGHVRVTLAYDPQGRSLDLETRFEIRQTVHDALLYFQETYGRYPLDDLAVVTVTRDFSQSHFGFVTLSNNMMAEYDDYATTLGVEDRRTVIAHEIAHQWWGHMVGWTSYRDQWFTEALASYSAHRFARKKLTDRGRSRLGPTSGWQAEILDTTEDGRALESLGPLTLGARLNSSRSDHAYEAIVYKKGALVFGMLARNYGEDAFDAILRFIVTSGRDRQISTNELLRMIRAVTREEVDVEEFAKQFIFGTGVPVIRFDYAFSRKGTSAWTVKGSAIQYMTVRFRYRIVPVESRYEVVREAIPNSKIAQWAMVVPFQVGIQRPAEKGRVRQGQLGIQWPDEKRKLGQTEVDLEKEIGNAYVYGRFWIRGQKITPFEFDVEYEPKVFWLDRDKETLALFYSPLTNSKLFLVGEAAALAGQRRFQEAEQKYRDALQAPKTTEFDPEGLRLGNDVRKAFLEAQDEILDVHAHLGIARIRLDQKQYSSVRPELREARKATSRASRVNGEIGILEGRLSIEEGDPESGFRLLRRLLLGRSATANDAEGYAWLAIAAKLTGHPNELKRALEAAQRKGVDATALNEASDPRSHAAHRRP